MRRWLVWFVAGILTWATAYVAFLRGVFETQNAIGRTLAGACLGWLVITVVALPLKLVAWLVVTKSPE
jgi:hypothetical protein